MKESFGERLKELRENKKLSQLQFAKEIGVGKSAISPWERNESEPILSNLVKIAKFFGVSIDYLAGLED
jgi:transcriptional regulator with XRE-family HTH domain